jgi:hypothetical protein
MGASRRTPISRLPRKQSRRQWLGMAVLGIIGFASRGVLAEISAESRALLVLQEWHGDFDGPAEKSLRAVLRTADWDSLWRTLDKPEPAQFIEGTHSALFAALGTRPTGGFGITAIDAQIRDHRVRLGIAEAKPAKDQFVAQVLTQPWAVFLLESKGRALDFAWQGA